MVTSLHQRLCHHVRPYCRAPIQHSAVLNTFKKHSGTEPWLKLPTNFSSFSAEIKSACRLRPLYIDQGLEVGMKQKSNSRTKILEVSGEGIPRNAISPQQSNGIASRALRGCEIVTLENSETGCDPAQVYPSLKSAVG